MILSMVEKEMILYMVEMETIHTSLIKVMETMS